MPYIRFSVTTQEYQRMLAAAQQERRPVSNWALCVALKECERLKALEENDNELEETPSNPKTTAPVHSVLSQTPVTEPKAVPSNALLAKIQAAKLAAQNKDSQ